MSSAFISTNCVSIITISAYWIKFFSISSNFSSNDVIWSSPAVNRIPIGQFGNPFMLVIADGFRLSLSSFPALRPSPHTTWPDRDRSGPDLDFSSSKRNWLCFPKHGETELEQIQRELGDPDLRPEPICFHPSPSDIFPSSHTSSPEIEDQAP